MEKFSKSYFCQKYLDYSGIKPNRRPVLFDEDQGYYGKVTRVFTNATWFPTWEEWQTQAQKVLDAAVVRYDAFSNIFTKGGSAYPISPNPPFLVEKSIVWPDGYMIWVNATCPSRSEFERTLAAARQRIAERKKELSEVRTASYFEPLPMLPVSSAEFQVERNDDVRRLIDAL